MKQVNYVLSFLMIILVCIVILLLSSNIVLRLSSTYVYHFNDSQAVLNIPYNVKGNEMAEGITKYLNSLSSKEFQVYEDNRIYKDPLFDKKEQSAMSQYKKILNLELGAGILALAGALIIYIYLLRGGFTEALRNTGRVIIGMLGLLMIVRMVVWSSKAFRIWAYNHLIGVKLPKDSILVMVLGDPMFKTYLLFATIFGVALLGCYAYVNHLISKENRMFY